MSTNKLLISFSGGRTSGYMTKWLMDTLPDGIEIVVVFANTGQEREETLEFVRDCDDHFGFKTVWIEAVVNAGRKSSTFKIVDFKTASRNGEPFEEVIKKYGIPNQSFPHCTRELKSNPIHAYIKSLGWKKYRTAIGIRADEIDRMGQYWYPLVKAGVTKSTVNTWWEQQKFNLRLQEHQGNCKWCWKKSIRKHLTLINEDPTDYDFPLMAETKYANAGAGEGGRVFFRGNKSTADLLDMAKNPFVAYHPGDALLQQEMFEFDLPSGCSESCEAFA